MIHSYINGITKKTEINVASYINTWMNVTFTLAYDKDWFKAKQVLNAAWDSYWEDPEAENECYGDWLCMALDEAGIKYEARYADDSDEDE